jgi:hypothetical protein
LRRVIGERKFPSLRGNLKHRNAGFTKNRGWKMKSNWKMVLIGSILLVLVLVGVSPVVRAMPSQAQPVLSLNDLLLRPEDICDNVAGCEEIVKGSGDSTENAKRTAESLGLPVDYQGGAWFHIVVFVKDDSPLIIGQAIYRYKSKKEAIARYEQLLKGLPNAPIGRETSIISTSEGPFKGIKGQVVEAQDPEWGVVYWFIGVRGELLTVLVVFSDEGAKGQGVLKQLVPMAVERMALSR